MKGERWKVKGERWKVEGGKSWGASLIMWLKN